MAEYQLIMQLMYILIIVSFMARMQQQLIQIPAHQKVSLSDQQQLCLVKILHSINVSLQDFVD